MPEASALDHSAKLSCWLGPLVCRTHLPMPPKHAVCVCVCPLEVVGVVPENQVVLQRMQVLTNVAEKVTAVGFEPTPFRTGALSQRLRPLGQTVSACTCPVD